ncbi:MAG: hypothetical protein RLY16_2802 [Bacteroidota bacterium]|jgi:hypothetical protein
MFIYNVTIKIVPEIQDAWLEWLKHTHVPEVLETGCFSKATIVRLLEVDDSDGPTYAIQYFAESKALYNRYIDKFANSLRDKSFEKWGNRFMAFRSLMQVIN